MPTLVLISTCNDIFLINKFPNSTYISLENFIIQMNDKYKIHHIFDRSNFDLEFLDTEIASIIANKWYRGGGNIGLFNNKLSIGMVLESYLREYIAHVIRYYISIGDWLKNFDEIVISDNTPKVIQDIILDYDVRTHFVKNNNISSVLCSKHHSPIIGNIKIHPFSLIMKIFQSVFTRKTYRKKVLVFSDWTYKQ